MCLSERQCCFFCPWHACCLCIFGDVLCMQPVNMRLCYGCCLPKRCYDKVCPACSPPKWVVGLLECLKPAPHYKQPCGCLGEFAECLWEIVQGCLCIKGDFYCCYFGPICQPNWCDMVDDCLGFHYTPEQLESIRAEREQRNNRTPAQRQADNERERHMYEEMAQAHAARGGHW